MKCLSVKQPYAEFIVKGLKTIELRSWDTKYRGELYIHASAEPDSAAMERFNMSEDKVQLRAVIGRVQLYNTVEYKTVDELIRDKDKHLAGPEYMNVPRFGFLLRQPETIVPIPMKGNLGIFNINVRELQHA